MSEHQNVKSKKLLQTTKPWSIKRNDRIKSGTGHNHKSLNQLQSTPINQVQSTPINQQVSGEDSSMLKWWTRTMTSWGWTDSVSNKTKTREEMNWMRWRDKESMRFGSHTQMCSKSPVDGWDFVLHECQDYCVPYGMSRKKVQCCTNPIPCLCAFVWMNEWRNEYHGWWWSLADLVLCCWYQLLMTMTMIFTCTFLHFFGL